MIQKIILGLFVKLAVDISMINPPNVIPMGLLQTDKKASKGNNTGSFTFMIIKEAVMYTTMMFYFVTLSPNSIANSMDIILIIFAYVGFLFRFHAYRELGHLYTFAIGIRENHKLITTGLYKYIMHPGYLGQMLSYGAFIIYFHANMLVTLLLVIYLIFSFVNRIKEEEQMLREHFGEEFIEYKTSRSRFIPGLF